MCLLLLLFLFCSQRQQEGGIHMKTKQRVIPEHRSQMPVVSASAVRLASHKRLSRLAAERLRSLKSDSEDVQSARIRRSKVLSPGASCQPSQTKPAAHNIFTRQSTHGGLECAHCAPFKVEQRGIRRRFRRREEGTWASWDTVSTQSNPTGRYLPL